MEEFEDVTELNPRSFLILDGGEIPRTLVPVCRLPTGYHRGRSRIVPAQQRHGTGASIHDHILYLCFPCRCRLNSSALETSTGGSHLWWRHVGRFSMVLVFLREVVFHACGRLRPEGVMSCCGEAQPRILLPLSKKGGQPHLRRNGPRCVTS